MTNAEALISKGQLAAAALVHSECCSESEVEESPECLNTLLDHFLHPEKNIDDPVSLDWCKWLIGGGKPYEVFSSNVKEFDYTEKCGLVWTADFVAFRCRTCGISQCMSLCAECFQKGNHIGHDFNMFKSQAGGACDCGDSSVMRSSGFCRKHLGPNAANRPTSPPKELMCIAENLLPRMILRLVQHLRANSIPSVVNTSPEEALSKYEKTIDDAKGFLVLLHDFSNLGAAMRSVMTKCLTNAGAYEKLMSLTKDTGYVGFMNRSRILYEDAINSLPIISQDAPKEIHDNILPEQLEHKTFLEELVFWTVKYEFPELLNCLLLKMLPDASYKEAFTRSFLLHYSRVSLTLVKSSNSDRLSNRVVHVSVQLFSNEKLAMSMMDNFKLLHIMVSSLVHNMMSKVLIQCQLHNTKSNHMVVDCSNHVMKDHCYWPLVSDLSNVLSHQPIALKFMSDNSLLTMWFGFLQMLQGMNVNERELDVHIEFEPTTYYASFSAELEASASPMWALVNHLKDENTKDYAANVIKHCISALRDWFNTTNFTSADQCDLFKVSFHIPLHRYFSVFVRQGVKFHGFSLSELLPDTEMLSLMMAHPLRVQTAFYEILCGVWVRNGVQIRGQAMTYLQCHFCKSMVDADIFLLQLCATQLPPVQFLSTVLERFQMDDWLTLSPHYKSSRLRIDQDQVGPMLESCLIFLVSILVLRTSLGLTEAELARLEMVTLLCMGDKQHSKLFDYMPDKNSNPIQVELFDQVLSEIGQYREPQFEAGGNMQQGIYLPKPIVWQELYDPLYVLLRAVHRKDFQSSMDRFSEFAMNNFSSDPNRLKTLTDIWAPWKIPPNVDDGFDDPRKLLHSRFTHGLIFNILYKTVHGSGGVTISENILSLAVFLLELSLTYPQKEFSGKEVAISKPCWFMAYEPVDLKYDTWFPTDWLSANLRHTISAIFLQPSGMELSIVPSASSKSHDDDDRSMEFSEGDYQVEPSSGQESPFVMSHRMLNRLPYSGEYSGTTVAVPQGYSEAQGASSVSSPSSIRNNDSRSVVSINESIISLLLKIHSKLSKSPDSYTPLKERSGFSVTPEYRSSRIGNGCFFVEKVLDRITELDEMCCHDVTTCRTKIWPSYHNDEALLEKNTERIQSELRKQKAKERQRQMMEQLSRQRQRFIANNSNSSSVEATMEVDDELTLNEALESEENSKPPIKEYDCVHCLQTTPSTEERPIGLVVLLQPTSVLSHRHRESASLVLPTSAEEEPQLAYDSLGAEFEERFRELSHHFHPHAYYLAVDKGWEGGVHIQSCGHYVHLSCRQSYMEHLKTQQRAGSIQTIAVDHGEYMCPMCRQLANSVLPIPPDNLHPFPSISPPKVLRLPEFQEKAKQIFSLSSMKKIFDVRLRHSLELSTPLNHAMYQLMDNFTKATRVEKTHYHAYFVVRLVNSIARINLELDLVQRGGTLNSEDQKSSSSASTVNKPKTCFVPLLRVLAIQMKVLTPRSFCKEWAGLTGLDYELDDKEPPREQTVPLLLQDCITLFLHFLLLLPFQLDTSLFETLTKALYNLHLVQSIARLACGLSEKKRILLKGLAAKAPELKTLQEYTGQVIEHLENMFLYPCDFNYGDVDTELEELESNVQKLLLPFLRIVALLRHYIYSEPLPHIQQSGEFEGLMKYLRLTSEDHSLQNPCLSVSKFSWFLPDSRAMLIKWFVEFSVLGFKAPSSARQLVTVNTLWGQPQLLKLPKNYDAIFQFYHKKACGVCKNVPKDPSICLLCGVLVCLKETCCRFPTAGTYEAVRHSLECGAGTAMFLAVNSSTIVVVRGKRACVWGSLYLDSFGEEDKELKRGKPLFLNDERYNLLQHQWITHRFNHTSRNWIWHKDQL